MQNLEPPRQWAINYDSKSRALEGLAKENAVLRDRLTQMTTQCETARGAVDEAVGHIGAARMQLIDSDDQIIAQHIRDAEVLLSVVFRAMHSRQE